ncbi:MAG: hypothetical protein PUJ59_06695 [Clostridiaceae bacterium]|nr:hypothetical protein [Clostridiaceae bacterium]MDY5889442.1 hypothetical protein [Oscillospiraceae bacterium]
MLTFYNIAKSIIYKAFAVVFAALLTLTNGVNGLLNGDIYPYDSNSKVVGLESIERAQGVTTDGEYWYFSGKSSLVKIGFDNQTVYAYNYKALDGELSENYNSKHIGGISYYNGYIYASLEDSKQWQHPVIALYDAETLEYTGICHEVSSEILTRGIPWVAVDAENGFIYASHSKTVEEIHCFDLDTFEYVKSFAVSDPMDAIQGGEVYKGKLYVGTNDSTRAVYTIDVKSGKVEKLFDRIMYQPKLIDNFGGEGEDLTVYPMEDGTLIHALDIGALFIDSNLRHYKWDV